MHIEEFVEEGEVVGGDGGVFPVSSPAAMPVKVYDGRIGLLTAKRAAVGIGARVLFYPTLMYNLIRNKVQSEFRWWDMVDEFLLLGAVPFPSDVPRLKQLGVQGVITLNESYETLVATSLYHANGIEHLVIPTRDYLFAPSYTDVCQAVDFIHRNASCGKITYVHCKAGRGRSTTIVLCYLVQHKQMTPIAAYDYVRLIRPRVLLAPSQWQAVQEYYRLAVKESGRSSCLDNPFAKSPLLLTTRNLLPFDESSFVVVSKSDLDGYDGDQNVVSYTWAELSLVYRVQFAGQAALARFSCFWLRYHARREMVLPDGKLGQEGCSFQAGKLGSGHSHLDMGVEVNL